MRRFECPRETDVVQAVHTGRWPNRAAADLRDHVASCTLCADAAVVADAIVSAEAELDGITAPLVPSSGAVWLRAQLRARAESARVAARPITVAQVAACVSLAMMAGAVFGATSSWFQGAIQRLWTIAGTARAIATPPPISIPAALGEHVALVVMVSLVALAAPVAVFLVARE